MAASAKDQPAYAGKHVLRWLSAISRTRDHVALPHEVVDGGGDGPLPLVHRSGIRRSRLVANSTLLFAVWRINTMYSLSFVVFE